MTNYSRLLLGFAICSVQLLASPALAPGLEAVVASGTVVTGEQIWSATAAPKVIHGAVVVAEGASLTIQAGARIQFDGDMQSGIHVIGKLTTLGTAEKPVVLESLTAKTDARWRGIWTDSKTASVRLNHASITNAVIAVDDSGGNAVLSGVEISHSLRGVMAAGKNAVVSIEGSKFVSNTFGVDAFDGATLGVTGSTFKGNRTAVSQSRTASFLASNTFENNQYAVSADDAGLVKGSGNHLVNAAKSSDVEITGLVTRAAGATVVGVIGADTVWTADRSPILVTSNVRVAAGATLTIQPGVTVRFAAGGGAGLTVDGRLVAVGTTEKPIYMTSSLDRGTRFSTAPEGFESNTASAGDWEGIRLTGKNVKSVVEHVTLRYSRNGVMVDGSASASLSGNIFRDDVVAVNVAGQAASISSSSDTFVNNTAGIYVGAGRAAVDAAAFSYGATGISGAAGASATVARSTVVAGTVARPIVAKAEFAVALNGADAMKSVAPVAAKSVSLGSITAAQNSGPVGSVLNGQATGPLYITPSFAAPLSGWAVPAGRGTPNAFAAVSGTAPYANELEIGILPAAGDNSIYQGKQHQVSGNGSGDILVKDVFIPAIWQNAANSGPNAGPVATYMWALGTGGSAVDYAVIGFRNYVTGTGSFTFWDDLTGAFTDLPAVTVKYGQWNNVAIRFTGSAFEYYVNGALVRTMLNNYGSTSINAMFMNAVNFYSALYDSATFNNVSAAPYLALWADKPDPSITTSSLPAILSGQPLGSFQMIVSEGAPPYTWGFAPAGNGGSGIQISSAGVISASSTSTGTYSVAFRVTDAENTTADRTITFSVGPPLTITSSNPPAGVVGRAYSHTFTSSTPASWGVAAGSTLPAGLSLSTAGVLSGTPAAGTGGTTSFVVTATDINGQKTATVSITIYNLITISTQSIPNGAFNQAYSTTVQATGGTANYTWSAAGLPGGLIIAPTTGTISGTPTTTGVFTAAVTATDVSTSTLAATASFQITIYNPITISTLSLPNGVLNQAYTTTVQATGGTASNYNWSATGLPGGLIIAPTTGTISGTPTTTGVFTAAVTARDVSISTLAATASFPITITSTAPTSLLIGATLNPGKLQTSYQGAITATGGKSPYQFAVTGGSLMAGLQLDASTGLISGIPKYAGGSIFTVEVRDSSFPVGVVDAPFSITILPSDLTLSPSSLPQGVVGVGYADQVITGSGGFAPYKVTLTSGTLPAGLTLDSNGNLKGIPTTAGTSDFVLSVSDANFPPATVQSSQSITVISNATATLLLGQSSISFKLSLGATAASLPEGASVAVGSSIPLQLLTYSVSGAAPWLTVVPGAGAVVSTPGNPISLGLNAAALSLAAGAYSSTVVVTCLAPSPCANTNFNILVSLQVTALPAILTLEPAVVSLTQVLGGSNTNGSLTIKNSGGGSLTGISVSQDAKWYTISAPKASYTAGAVDYLSVLVDPNNGLAAGSYASTATFTSATNSATVQVNLVVRAADAPPKLSLSQSGGAFSMAVGSNGPGSAGFNVGTTATTTWSATNANGTSWLTVNTTSGSSTPDLPGVVSFSINSTATTLTPGNYSGLIQVVSASSSISYAVSLKVEAAATPVVLDPSPAGVLFLTNELVNPSSQTISVRSNSATSSTYQASSNKPWLNVSPATGATSSATPGASTISVVSAGLAPGLYEGRVGYQASGGNPMLVSVTMLITTDGGVVVTSGSRTSSIAPQIAGCTPTKLYAAQTALVDNFRKESGIPVPLSVIVIDNCGNFSNAANVTVSFSNGDDSISLSSLAQAAGSGVYSGTWTPAHAYDQANVVARATAPGLDSGAALVIGQVSLNDLAILTRHSTTNVYSPQVGGSLAPGSMVSLYGTNLVTSAAVATKVPLTTKLNGTSVSIGGVSAPLYYVGPNQINAQVPSTLLPGSQYEVVVSTESNITAPDQITVSSVSPGVAETYTGIVLAQDAITYRLITQALPAQPGMYVVIYLSGLGATTVTVPPGAASPSSPLAYVKIQPTLTLNGTDVPVLFAGLSPGLSGLYQINFQVPADTAEGNYQLVVTQGDVSAQSVILPVQK